MAKHTEESVHRTLQTEWASVERREINHGIQFTLPEGTKINFFPSTARLVIQGKDPAERKRAEQLLQSARAVSSTSVGTAQNPTLLPQEKVFIVYGHDTDAREQLELLLRRLKLEPVLDSLASRHEVKWHWLKGHSGHIGNERCDVLANAEIAKIKKAFSPEQLKGLLAEFSTEDSAEQSQDELESK